ncbi:HIRAN domain-containing protein [Sphingobium sp. JS3065]|uniref:HIRAN domain-containing protein n=1 Tax=Sphingobium sp. JS3065 TaxID=2970925 RepID=UPI002264EDD1|nr:HIRAN domain-containing protein [Sphingobium sp. JS3065]UZW54028.1 HIRAN domain-containing protein [Sphingobium sp. JS3065]
MSQLSLIIVGADHPNKDKSNRRFEILLCKPQEEVHLVPEPKNPVDPQAVAVFSARGVQIGYVRGRQSQLIRSYLSRGKVTAAIFQDRHDEGAIIRVGMDGELPTLPERPAEAEKDDDSGFYPDYIPPDD